MVAVQVCEVAGIAVLVLAGWLRLTRRMRWNHGKERR